ncbi:unnamed protein product [Heligmosomoides polygyrus]|uniref:long-chain-fatty-acid--CoA ligase n=1 Tax=Heligmosomoides polygyrus TaxID=6339 RepID=A0A183FD07_HELPZ|nr:unnamed protein product [Heligmosomoides polygyrus]
MILFFIYDMIVYIPFKLFADPSQKLSMSQRVKAAPVKPGDPTSPWRHTDVKGGQLEVHAFDGCSTLAEQWNEAVRRFSDFDCLGTREVLSIVKEKQKNGKIFEKWEMGNYHWRSFRTVDERVNMVASALISLGCKVQKAIQDGVNVNTIVYFSSPDPASSTKYDNENVQVHTFDQLLTMGNPKPLQPRCTPEDIAVIMYTSGTTGNPKGVMISHENIVAAVAGQIHLIPTLPGDTYIGYLPLAHILEVCAETVAYTRGVRIGYSSAQTLFDRAPKIKKGTKGDCFVLKPTIMACVPAIMDRIHKAVIEEVNSNSQLFREMFRACYERKRARYEEGYTSFILNKLVFNRIGKMLGGNIRCVLSGGAPLSPETQRFMNICFCCPVVQGYGLTETCGGGTLGDTYDLSTGSVGPPLTCCEILLEEWKEAGYSPKNEKPQGEILIGGKNVGVGYYNNPEKTKEDFVIRNGKRYFATGDIGEFREDGCLRIIDRKKDLLKLAHGEYISLGNVETHIQTGHGIDSVCVYGDSTKDYLVALIVPDHKYLRNKAEEVRFKSSFLSVESVPLGVSNGDFESLCTNKEIVASVLKDIQSHVAGRLEKVEVPRKIYLCSEPWTPTTGLVTEALKLKRKTIEKAFRKQLDEMYS